MDRVKAVIKANDVMEFVSIGFVIGACILLWRDQGIAAICALLIAIWMVI